MRKRALPMRSAPLNANRDSGFRLETRDSGRTVNKMSGGLSVIPANAETGALYAFGPAGRRVRQWLPHGKPREKAHLARPL
jgi:hypothetical protein